MSRLVPNSFQIHNAIVDDFLSSLTGNELKCYLLIVRKTRGWHKESDAISISQFEQATGISNRVVVAACKSLVQKGLIIQSVGARGINVFSVNDAPTYDEKSQVEEQNSGDDLLRKVTCDEKSPMTKSHSTYDEKSQEPMTKSHTQKDNKNTTLKDKSVLPNKKPEKTFAEYMAECTSDGKDFIPDGSEPEKVAERLELSAEMLDVFWQEFQSVHLDPTSKSSKKRQADWLKTIANYLRKNYFELWGFDRDSGLPFWTQKGLSMSKAMAHEVAA